ncbi:MAG TPA: serine/threonine-protein kinase, partial [Kofleriaceae bacterium]|nr:serine/threonine-protein kinase [Kofleriaceae bacterium]
MGDAKTEPGAVPGRISTPTVDIRGGGEVVPAPDGPFEANADRFEPRGELGRGGMGRVEDAFDHALGRAVAIKHMLVTSERDLARFAREARITARLEHPGIVPVHDAGRGPDGTPYYVMRRIDGRPLAQLVAGAALADRLALIPNVLAACDALAFAHARGVVHRDLKPDNILVGPFGETLVIDWGLASDGAIASPDDARTIAGTPGFMAPEQARGEPVDARADVYALGATLFYVLSCELLYEVTPTEMVTLAASDRPPNWRALPARVPADLRAILEKALASSPAQRYGDAGALAADLRRFVTGNLVGAYDYGAWARLVRFARRHRVALVVAGLSALALAVVAIVSVRRIVAERDQANTARALAETRQREA